MKHCTDCKWYDADQHRRQSRISAASVWVANAIIGHSSYIKPMEDEEIRTLQKYSHEAEEVYIKWEMMLPLTCGHSMVVRPEDGKQFDDIQQARQFCGYRTPEHWEKQTEVVMPWRMEAYEKTFEIIKNRIERSAQRKRERDAAEEEFLSDVQESSIFQRIKNWFSRRKNSGN